MENVVKCPTCSKKYKLPAAPPPTFQCRNCGTVLDLSEYQAQSAPVAPAADPAPARGSGPSRGARSGAPARGGRHGGRRGGRSAPARGGRGRRGREAAPADDDGYEDEPPRGYHRKDGPNSALIIGSIAAVVVAGVLLFVMMGNKKEKPQEKPKAVAEQPIVAPPVVEVPVEPKDEPKPKRVAKGREDEKRPELREGLLENIPIPEGKRKYNARSAELQTYPYPDHVTAEEKQQIEEWIEALEWGARDARDAADGFVQMDARLDDGALKPGQDFKAVGRLVSEMKNIYDRFDGDLTSPELLSRLMTVDQILRRIDGMQERDFNERMGIRAQSTDKDALTIMKRWNWWYDLEKWRKRREPWDVGEDLVDAEEADWTDE